MKKTNLKDIPALDSLEYSVKYNPATLNAFRLFGDPLCDALAQDLHFQKGGLVNIHDLLESVQKYKEEPIYASFLDSMKLENFPNWVDWDMVERAQVVHNMLTPFMGISLLAGSLIGGGQFVNSSVVTALAGNLTTNPARRVDETARLLTGIAFPGALKPGGVGFESLLRVRLLHSALRTWLPTTDRLKNQESLVPEGYYVQGEVPINQQDLAITLGIFCYQNLRSLRLMNIVVSSSDIIAYVHMWKLIGWILGICDELLPTSLEDQEEFMMASMKHQGYPGFFDPENLKKFVGSFSEAAEKSTKGTLPRSVVDTYLLQMVRYLNGNQYTGNVIDDLGNNHWSILLTKTLGAVFGTIIPRLPFGEKMLVGLNSWRLKEFLSSKDTPIGHGAGTGKDISKL